MTDEKWFTHLKMFIVIEHEGTGIVSARYVEDVGDIIHWKKVPTLWPYLNEKMLFGQIEKLLETDLAVEFMTTALEKVQATDVGESITITIEDVLPPDHTEELMKLKRDELVTLCDDNNVVYISTDTKAQLIEKYIGS